MAPQYAAPWGQHKLVVRSPHWKQCDSISESNQYSPVLKATANSDNSMQPKLANKTHAYLVGEKEVMNVPVAFLIQAMPVPSFYRNEPITKPFTHASVRNAAHEHIPRCIEGLIKESFIPLSVIQPSHVISLSYSDCCTRPIQHSQYRNQVAHWTTSSALLLHMPCMVSSSLLVKNAVLPLAVLLKPAEW